MMSKCWSSHDNKKVVSSSEWKVTTERNKDKNEGCQRSKKMTSIHQSTHCGWPVSCHLKFYSRAQPCRPLLDIIKLLVFWSGVKVAARFRHHSNVIRATKLYTAKSLLFINCFWCRSTQFRLLCYLSRRQLTVFCFWYCCNSVKRTVDGHISYMRSVFKLRRWLRRCAIEFFACATDVLSSSGALM